MKRRILAVSALALTAACGVNQSATTTPAPLATTTSQPASAVAVPSTTTMSSQPIVALWVVDEVVDGDTVKIHRDGPVTTVRILGINAPETKDPNTGIGCWGPEASAWATTRLAGKHVDLRIDPTQDAKDKYGRTLGYITLPDGSDYSVNAARAGMGKSYLYDRPVQEAPQIQAAEAEAQAAKQGLWGPPCNGNTDAPPKATPPPAPKTTKKAVAPQPAPSAPPADTGSSAAYYKNCDAARAAGVAPLHRGDPGYRAPLDRDNDGIACE